MTAHRLRVGVAAATVILSACSATEPNDRDPNVCPQTREFANYGCARFIAVLTTSSGAPAAGIALFAMALDTTITGELTGVSSMLSDERGRAELQITWYVRPPTRDTVPMRIVALRPGSLAQRVDSMDVGITFARVGQRPSLDTTYWRVRGL